MSTGGTFQGRIDGLEATVWHDQFEYRNKGGGLNLQSTTLRLGCCNSRGLPSLPAEPHFFKKGAGRVRGVNGPDAGARTATTNHAGQARRRRRRRRPTTARRSASSPHHPTPLPHPLASRATLPILRIPASAAPSRSAPPAPPSSSPAPFRPSPR